MKIICLFHCLGIYNLYDDGKLCEKLFNMNCLSEGKEEKILRAFYLFIYLFFLFE